jgi:hypothetical protein
VAYVLLNLLPVTGTGNGMMIPELFPILVLAAAPAPEVPQLIANPGFEEVSGIRAAGWSPFEKGYEIDREVRRGGAASARCSNRTGDERSGATAHLQLDQKEPAPVLVTGWSKAEGVSGFPNNDYSIYVDLIFADGTPLWGQTAPFATGSHDWQMKKVLIVPKKPLRSASVHALFRHHAGTVWFDDFSASQLSGGGFFDGQPVAAPKLPEGAASGWFARDVAAGSEVLPLDGTGGAPGEAAARLGLRLASTGESAAGRIVRARIADTTGKPRAVTLYYVERFDAAEPVWWNDVRDSSPAGSGERANLTRINVGATGSMSLYPFGCVTGRGKGRAVGLAPLQGPRVARIGFHAGAKLLHVAFDFGLTGESLANSDGAGHGRADAEVFRADVDPAWGFRAAASAYYETFPEAFERRAKAEGIWIPFTDPSKVRGVEDFGIAYHEGDNSIVSDDRLGILSFRYTEPMTWWMQMGKDAPRTYETALGLVEKAAAGTDEGRRRQAQAVQDSGTHAPEGRFNVEFADAPWTQGAIWVLNPNPRLPHAPDRWTKGRLSYTVETADRMYGAAAKGVQDGEYLDSIEGWADVLDFRAESIRHAASPPAFTTDGFRPVIPTWFSVWELASFMRDDLHRRGKLLMANSTPWRIHAFAPILDVMGTETNWNPGGRWQPDSDSVFDLRRTLCRHKPYLLLQNTDFEKFGPAEVERYFARSMFWGVYPSMFSVDASTHPYWTEPRWYERDRALFLKYIPAIRRLSAAGWEPITFARADHPAVRVERFGARLFTALGGGGERLTATLEIDAVKLGLAGAGPGTDSHPRVPSRVDALGRVRGEWVEAADLVTGEILARLDPGPVLRVPVPLDPGGARAIELRSSTARIPVLAWIGPPPEETTPERYRELAEAGFTHSFTDFPSAEAAEKALDVAAGAGVKLLLALPDLQGKPEETVRRLGGHPALGGWYLRDEPSAKDFPALGEWARRIAAVDPVRPIYINLFPNYASAEQLGCPTYKEHLDRFVEEVPVPIISYDHYPVVGDSLRPEYYENLEMVAAAARRAGKPFWAFTLAVAHGPYPIPTIAHLRLQLFSDLAYGAQGLQYFTYWTPKDPTWNYHGGPIENDGKRTPVYDLARRANEEVRALSAAFLGARVVRVGHAGDPLPRGTTPCRLEPPVKALATGGVGAVVSLLENGPRRHLAVVNRDLARTMPLEVELDGSRAVERVKKDGAAERFEGNSFRASVEPGDMVLLSWSAADR